jgi:succinylglutamate desuccinylase
MDKTQTNTQFFLDRNNIDLSHSFTIDSQKPGPHLVIVGGLHGSEPAGVEAIIAFVKNLETKNLQLNCGQITFILGNPKAYLKNQRFIDANLNRVFLDTLPDNYEGQRAGEIRNFLVKNKPNLILDLHSVSVGNWQMVAYIQGQNNRDLALELSPIDFHLVVDLESLPGSLMQDAEKIGAKGIAVECGNHTGPESAQVALYHINQSVVNTKILNSKDLLPATEKNFGQDIYIYKTLEPIKPKLGFSFISNKVNTGTFVKAGEVYAKHDEGLEIAKQDCYIVMPDKNPSIYDNDAGFLCTLEIVKK